MSAIKPRPKLVDGVKKVTPMWKTDTGQRPPAKPKSPYRIFVATPVHDQCSIHYAQGLLEFQKLCFEKNVLVTFQIMKSSLVTQGRNLCVSGFLESDCTHMLFVDSDIIFNAHSILRSSIPGASLTNDVCEVGAAAGCDDPPPKKLILYPFL